MEADIGFFSTTHRLFIIRYENAAISLSDVTPTLFSDVTSF